MAIPREVIEKAGLDSIVGAQAFLRTNRLFYLDPSEHRHEGWYFKVRGPRLYGPYLSRDDANAVLDRMLCEYLASNTTARR
ncbi:MAG: hypothetical protein LBV36_00050 [Chromatiales bacterium]|jgi:hypothetical protein|nr:hypothetical protein [Chromatiales bacterium]